MTKKDSKKGSSKNHVQDKESCGLSCLKEVELQNNNDKKINVNNNNTNIHSTYSTPRESIFEIPNNSKHLKEHFSRPHTSPQIQSSKNQSCQAPRSSRRTLERQDTPRPRSETPPIIRGESCELRAHSKSKLKGKFHEITSHFLESIKRKNKSTSSKSRMSHHRLHHKSWSPRSSRSISPRDSMGRYGSIPRSPRGYRQYNCTNSQHTCSNHQCEGRRCKSRSTLN